jgi:hypothetical protein
MSTNGGIDVNMVPVGGSSSSADPVHSISHQGSNVLHDSTNTATKDGQKQKRKSPCVTQKLLRVVVDQGGDMTPEQIMGAGHVSRSTAFNIAKRAKNYSSVGNPVHKMPKVRNQELVLQTVASLAYHLVDFPYAVTTRAVILQRVCSPIRKMQRFFVQRVRNGSITRSRVASMDVMESIPFFAFFILRSLFAPS